MSNFHHVCISFHRCFSDTMTIPSVAAPEDEFTFLPLRDVSRKRLFEILNDCGGTKVVYVYT